MERAASNGSRCARATLRTTAALVVVLAALVRCASPSDGEEEAVLAVPETERWVLPTLTKPVQVIRTEAGVPHVYAANEHDLRVVQGFITARDRYFQMVAGSRSGLGTLSGLLGELALSADQQSRGQGMTFVADRILGMLTASEAATFDAYLEGVNAYVDAVRARTLPTPKEIGTIGLLRPGVSREALLPYMTRRDLAGFVAVIMFQQGFETGDPLRQTVRDQLEAAFAGAPDETLRREGVLADIFDRVRPVTDVSTTAGFGLETGAIASASPPAEPTKARVEAGTLARLVASGDRLAQRLRGGRGVDFGSNAWAVMGRATADGAALLAGDGHLPLTVPSLLYPTGLDTRVFGSRADGLAQLGLFFPGVPLLAVGTNGHVAWSITYLGADLTDWYAEEVTLDAAGRPASTRFDGEAKPLTTVTERYDVVAVSLSPGAARTEQWDRYVTFDGRWIASIEGRPAQADTVPGPGEAVVNVSGDYVIPDDVDLDGKISAISFDYTGFDTSDVLTVIEAFGAAERVSDMREASRRLVAFGQNVVAADVEGHVWYGSYSALPCREGLPRTGDGFAEGADPRLLLDGTRYGGFEVPLDAQGMPDERDPARCLVPFDEWPMALDPARGYVATANNDIGHLTTDGSLADDAYYIGGPFAPGFRAQTITDRLTAEVEARSADAAAMSELQNDHRSPLGSRLVPALLEAIAAARTLADGGGALDPDDARLAGILGGDRAGIEAAEARLSAWIARGAVAASGVATFYDTPTDDDRADAVATMIFGEWLRRLFVRVFGDEGVDAVWTPDPRFLRSAAILSLVEGRGPGNPAGLASYDATTEESVFWDVVGTPEIESSEEMMLGALTDALAALRAAPSTDDPTVGGFGTDDMDRWLWGLRHQVELVSLLVSFAPDTPGIELLGDSIDTRALPLAPDLAPGDPRAALEAFPRPGDFFAVDAANPSFDAGASYRYRNGPVMRMVIRLGRDRVDGTLVIPGGQSAAKSSEHFADQAALWLGNDTLPFRYELDDVLAGATGREVYTPD